MIGAASRTEGTGGPTRPGEILMADSPFATGRLRKRQATLAAMGACAYPVRAARLAATECELEDSMRKHPSLWSRAASLLMLMLVPHLTGCYVWQPVTVSPRQLIEDEQPERVRVFSSDGTSVELTEVRVETGFLTGVIHRILPVRRTVRIAFADITAVERRRFDGMKTIGAAALTGAGAFVAVVAAAVFLRTES